MKKNIIINLVLILIISGPILCFSKESNYSYELEFGNPKAEKILQIGGNGDLNITGYKGDKILISADENIYGEDEKVNEKTKGLKKIGGSGFQINNNKNENRIVISRSIIGQKIDLDIKVPNNITLRVGGGGVFNPGNYRGSAKYYGKNFKKYGSFVTYTGDNYFTQVGPGHNAKIPPVTNGVMAGNISIQDLAGTIEVSTIVGNIDMENIEGSVTASSVQGNLKIVFNKLKKENALYFSTVNGEIDITFPKKAAADIIARTLNGNVYSGFDGEIKTVSGGKDPTDATGLRALVSTFLNPNHITSKINGGGQEIYLSTINGNIYIRKGE